MAKRNKDATSPVSGKDSKAKEAKGVAKGKSGSKTTAASDKMGKRKSEPAKTVSPQDEHQDLITVAIGSSAGGLKPLRAIFQTLPPDLGVAFVIISHLDPHHPSELASIISHDTTMPVREVGEKLHMQPNQVYVIAPDRQLVVTGDEITTVPFDEPRGQRTPIDRFFRSLAELHRDGFAIVLSGSGSDGSIGVRSIKAAGGVVMVQDPNEADYSSMPRSAVETGCVDVIAPAVELAGKLEDLIAAKKRLVPTKPGENDNEVINRILSNLRTRTGHDFSNYKSPTIRRRLNRRMQLKHIENLEDYLKLLRGDPEEVQRLFGDFLISVTTFFRDPEAFDTLAQKVIPDLFSKHADTEPIRIWVAGCATGEEVYSIVILLLEEALRQEKRPEFQIFATDIDTRAIDFAREGLYPMAIEADVSEERLKNFFTREGDHFRIKKTLRDMIVFASHSILKDPPFSRLDLVSCRNLLIYLERDVQTRVLSTFHYALNPGGYLFLGSAETADAVPDRFSDFDPKHRVYVAIRRARDRLLPVQKSSFVPTVTMPRDETIKASTASRSEAALHRQALEELAPPSLLVDSSHLVVHVSETAGRYLRHPAGTLTRNAMQIILPELKVELGHGLRNAFKNNQATLSKSIPVQFNGTPHRVILQIRPVLRDHKVTEALVLIIEGDKIPNAETAQVEAPRGGADSKQMARLFEELEQAQEQARLSAAEFEATNEDLRAANEELQSINEEYRSTSEELETSKEELQSMNEELQTLNAELKSKIEGVWKANADLQNLIAATEGDTLFLDLKLRIKLFTPGMSALFNISTTDLGRPITDFTHKLTYDRLAEDAKKVLKDLVPIEREVTDDEDSWYLMRMRPYRTLENNVDGVVLTFVDVSPLHRAEEAIRKSDARFRALVNASSYIVFRMGPDWEEMRELDGRGFIKDTTTPSRNWLNEYIDPEDQPTVLEAIQKAIQTKGLFELEHRVRRPDGTLGWTLSRAIPIMDKEGEIVEWFGAATDITERRQAQEELRQTGRIEAIGRLAGGIAHDFNNLLTTILANVELAEMRVEDAQTTSLLEQAAKAAELGASLNRRLLSLTGTRALQPQVTNINVPVMEVCQLLERAVGDRIELTYDLADELWQVFVDAGQIEGTLLNLVLNARDAMPEGGKIVVSTRNVTVTAESAQTKNDVHPGDYVCLTVSDTGTGMPKEVLERATEAFFTTKLKGEGTGLGLYSVSTFARQSGGFMELKSSPGEGSTISIFLPRSTESNAQKPPKADGQVSLPDGDGETILVVEDNLAVREATRQRLETLGYRVLEAGSAVEAITLLKSDKQIHLVFTDIIMPGKLSGLDLAQWIRTEKPEVAVLLNSGYQSEINRMGEAKSLRAVDMLSKPYSLDQLSQAVRKALK